MLTPRSLAELQVGEQRQEAERVRQEHDRSHAELDDAPHGRFRSSSDDRYSITSKCDDEHERGAVEEQEEDQGARDASDRAASPLARVPPAPAER